MDFPNAFIIDGPHVRCDKLSLGLDLKNLSDGLEVISLRCWILIRNLWIFMHHFLRTLDGVVPFRQLAYFVVLSRPLFSSIRLMEILVYLTRRWCCSFALSLADLPLTHPCCEVWETSPSSVVRIHWSLSHFVLWETSPSSVVGMCIFSKSLNTKKIASSFQVIGFVIG